MDKTALPTNAEKLKASEFVPPRHWVGVEELSSDYWANSANQEKRGQEFFEKPVEWLSKIDETDKAGLARRDFLTIMGASMAMASAACARRPVHKIIPYVIQPEHITPGVAEYYATTSRDCPCGCGILAKTREGRPIKLEGNPEHPVNSGALCARGQASVLNLYDPERLKTPIVRGKGEITWGELDGTIAGALKTAASGTGRVRMLSAPSRSPSTTRLVQEFLSPFKAGAWVQFDPMSPEALIRAQELSYGTALIPDYRFDRANYVLSLGADFLGTWMNPVGFAKDWGKNRQINKSGEKDARFSKLVTFEAHFSLTGSNSDERFAVRPGDELKIAMAILSELLVTQKKSSLAGDAQISNLLQSYSAEKVAKEVEIEGGAKTLARLADELWAARGKSLVVGGSTASQSETALALQVAINFLNSILGNDGVTIGHGGEPIAHAVRFSEFLKLIADMKAGLVDVLFIYRSNPIYQLPSTLGFREALGKVPVVVAIADREDETAKNAMYVLPDHHYLENWGDYNPRTGVYSLQQPTIPPLHDTRAFEDTLIVLAKSSDTARGLIAKSKDWHEFLRANWIESHYRAFGAGVAADIFWENSLRTGVVSTAVTGNDAARTFKSAALSELPKYAANDAELSLVVYPKISLYDGAHANNAWLQEMPDPLSSVTWDNYLNIGTTLAQKFEIKNDDVVELRSGDVTVRLPANVQPGMHPNVVSVALGYGRTAVGKVGNFAGVNVSPFLQVKNNQLVFSGQPATLRKTGEVYQLARTQWHTVTENRPVINDITLAEYRKNPGKMMETDPELKMEKVPSIWSAHEYTKYRWGMSIDLSSCIGCGACVIGCQAENNIAIVGRDQVRASRQMHWIKIDRYYSGPADNPSVVFQPMICQHCENAPCETVCPVLATVHDDEGLNVQVYNRCVGTRYCQNNCPYKVRRFNFFDHWKAYEGTMNLAWNPDVTVRSRGIMEKCTFCLQRITAGKDAAKDEGEKAKDGAIKTACQQTCPTDAIVFGDMNDPNSRVSKLKKIESDFRVLENLNTKPAVSYMTKVRNRAEMASAEGGQHA